MHLFFHKMGDKECDLLHNAMLYTPDERWNQHTNLQNRHMGEMLHYAMVTVGMRPSSTSVENGFSSHKVLEVLQI
jgi:hypothetical protein